MSKRRGHRPVTMSRAGLSRPPIGAVWGWVQTVAARTATDSLLPGGALVLSPHQDDETIGCGLLMAEKANRGSRSQWLWPPKGAMAGTRQHRGRHLTTSPRSAAVNGIGPSMSWQCRKRIVSNSVSPTANWATTRARLPTGSVPCSAACVRPRCSSRGPATPIAITVSWRGLLAERWLRFTIPVSVLPTVGRRTAPVSAPPDPPRSLPTASNPGEGLWPDGRPSRVTVATAAAQLVRSVLRLVGRRSLLLRAPGSRATKVAAIDAYNSQRSHLGGELRYVWDAGVELYWPMDEHGSGDARGQSERST